MSDCKMNLVRDLEARLTGKLTAGQISEASEALIQALADYDVEERCTDIVQYEDINGKLIRQYCACLFVDGKSEKTAYQYRRTCEKLAEAAGKPFTEMTVYDIRYFLGCEKKRGVSNRTLENTRANISAFFQWMQKEDIIAKNPCLNINPVKYDDVIRKPFTEIEIDQLRTACQNLKERAIIECLLSTGIRVSEMTDLRISDINQTSLSVHVRCGKGGKGRMTYATALAMRHINMYLINRSEDGDMIFYNAKHEPLKAGGVRHILNELGQRAGVENVHPHRFRRTFATKLVNRGMDIQEIMRLMGHSNINTTMTYVYQDDTKISTSYKTHIA